MGLYQLYPQKSGIRKRGVVRVAFLKRKCLPSWGMGCFWPHLNSRRPGHLLPCGTQDGVPKWVGARALGAGLSACRAEGDRLLSENP